VQGTLAARAQTAGRSPRGLLAELGRCEAQRVAGEAAPEQSPKRIARLTALAEGGSAAKRSRLAAEEAPQARYGVGQEVEVLRSDGVTWSLGNIIEIAPDAVTVRMGKAIVRDGRCIFEDKRMDTFWQKNIRLPQEKPKANAAVAPPARTLPRSPPVSPRPLHPSPAAAATAAMRREAATTSAFAAVTSRMPPRPVVPTTIRAATAAASKSGGAGNSVPSRPQSAPALKLPRTKSGTKPAPEAFSMAQKREVLQTYSVSELRTKARYEGVSQHVINTCLEKKDLIEAVVIVMKEAWMRKA